MEEKVNQYESIPADRSDDWAKELGLVVSDDLEPAGGITDEPEFDLGLGDIHSKISQVLSDEVIASIGNTCFEFEKNQAKLEWDERDKEIRKKYGIGPNVSLGSALGIILSKIKKTE